MTSPWLPATPHWRPRWRGFNLLEKFHRDWNNQPFVEDDFRLIAQLGFNFVRLPMDYRTWIQEGDWTKFNEAVLQQIDQAVAWGEKYRIHVMINFHRAPGYTVASPPEERRLWTDPEAQRVCALHWATFARRYRGFPSERLSFNLMNEPAGVEPEVYVAVVKPIIEAIRREDPDRLIVSDGLPWGTRPILELAELNVAQATWGYPPMPLTHYQASWVRGADQYPVPTWPLVIANGILAAPGKREWPPEAREPLVIAGPFPAVDGGLPEELAGGRLGLGAVELPGELRHPRQRTEGCEVRGVGRSPTRPEDVGVAAAVWIFRGGNQPGPAYPVRFPRLDFLGRRALTEQRGGEAIGCLPHAPRRGATPPLSPGADGRPNGYRRAAQGSRPTGKDTLSIFQGIAQATSCATKRCKGRLVVRDVAKRRRGPRTALHGVPCLTTNLFAGGLFMGLWPVTKGGQIGLSSW